VASGTSQGPPLKRGDVGMPEMEFKEDLYSQAVVRAIVASVTNRSKLSIVQLRCTTE
jgi:hypothetical protein